MLCKKIQIFHIIEKHPLFIGKKNEIVGQKQGIVAGGLRAGSAKQIEFFRKSKIS
jgi:hypothetical protein